MKRSSIELYRPKAPVRSRRRVRLALALGVLLMLLAGAHSMARSTDMAESGGRESEVLVAVKSGDTLWGIASRIAPHIDTRYAVFVLRQANELASATILPGQTLKIPVSLLPE